MANREVRVEKSEIVIRDGEERHPNPILCLLSRFPFLNFLQPKRDSAKPDALISEKKTPAIAGERGEEGKKPVVVKVPNPKTTDLPSLKLEGEECDRNTNPIVLWQVYAIGGFFVLNWVFARWKERRAKKKSSDDEPSPADD
ncbi:hypothetical protein RHMOL_Rhmol09G0204300 [Rhododendron molle]|uniref:Uncharacterized protein n=1 Tax=Rhododendron molle TaxID=49168 RepID=A0ACC0MGM3_RHOML|nr:hypothetical protein RHMOL_Rhmol09G0204300 [Rhododendron molle]